MCNEELAVQTAWSNITVTVAYIWSPHRWQSVASEASCSWPSLYCCNRSVTLWGGGGPPRSYRWQETAAPPPPLSGAQLWSGRGGVNMCRAPLPVRQLTHPQQLHPLRFLLTHRGQIFQEMMVIGPETLVHTNTNKGCCRFFDFVWSVVVGMPKKSEFA